MAPAKRPALNSVLKQLPSVDELLCSPTGEAIIAADGNKYVVDLTRAALAGLRAEIGGDTSGREKAELFAAAESKMLVAWQAGRLTGMRRVINATGVVIHTNLGRAPLSDAARNAVVEAAGYCTLEYDAATGKRGKRGNRAETILAELTGAEGVLIVNNCAAAAFFVLNAFAAGGEVIISRGELVEIGGDFRVPDVLEQSGATLAEVGTTNRTKLADYEKAINERTRMILRVHPSNYRIVGFTAMPTLGELAALAKEKSVILYEDLGSGALIDLKSVGIDEPTVANSIAAGVDLVTFSGDKLLGGPQAGIIAGKRDLIERLRKHPLYRALRVDKLACAALESTLEPYRRETAFTEIPVLQMLSLKKREIEARVRRLVSKLEKNPVEITNLKFEIIDGVSAIGGGAAPTVQLETKLLVLSHSTASASTLEYQLRNSDPPVIARIVDDRVLIDLRTVPENDEAQLTAAIFSADKL